MKKIKWKVRQVKPSEVPEVSKLVYKAYGYTYGHTYVYYPEKIASMNTRGKIHSAIALTGNNEIAGHVALHYLDGNPRIAELAQAVVKPEFRSRGCLRAITEYLVQLAVRKGLRGIFTQTVTDHIFSQRTAHRFGFKDCAVLLGIIPLQTEFRGIDKPLTVKGSFLIQFRYLQVPPGLTCYPPARHGDMIDRIYENLGVTNEIRHETPAAAICMGESILGVEVMGTLRFARIMIERMGPDIVSQVKIKVRELCFRYFEVIHLHLNLSDPCTPRVTESFEDFGFFFAGLLPWGFAGGDALILQFLNNLRLDYHTIHMQSGFGRDMLSYIEALDPNQP